MNNYTTTTTDNFELDERKGRQKLQRDYDASPYEIESYFTKGKYDKIDNFATAHTPFGNITYANEVKNRDIPMDLYKEEGYILEYIKYDALMDATVSGYTPLYTNYFQDGRVVWNVSDIKDIDNRWQMKWCTETTAENYGKRVLKKVVLLKPEEGKIRKYKQ